MTDSRSARSETSCVSGAASSPCAAASDGREYFFRIDRVLYKAERRGERLRRPDARGEPRRHAQLFEQDTRGDELIFKPRRHDKAAVRNDARGIAAPRRASYRHAHAEHLRGVVGLSAKRVRSFWQIRGRIARR